jgi:hypothetical protein
VSSAEHRAHPAGEVAQPLRTAARQASSDQPKTKVAEAIRDVLCHQVRLDDDSIEMESNVVSAAFGQLR